MFAYCGNNPVIGYDPSGEFGLLTGMAIVGIGISAAIGGIVAGLQTAQSGGSVAEIMTSAAIGAVTSGTIATVAAVAAASAAVAVVTTATVAKVAATCAVVGAVGEAVSITSEYYYHKADPDYRLNPVSTGMRIVHAAGISATAGSVSFGINTAFTGSDEFAGLAISTEFSTALGCIDYGTRVLIEEFSANTNTLGVVQNSSTAGGRPRPRNYVALAMY